jgi:hypothetical protein
VVRVQWISVLFAREALGSLWSCICPLAVVFREAIFGG